MKSIFCGHRYSRWIYLFILFFPTANPRAFSLLGPFDSWMVPAVGFYRDAGYDVGGPRNLGDEFRWNIPVLTYGFDDEFKNFFGPEGIADIEDGINLLNTLPSYSQIDLSRSAAQARRIHETARLLGLLNLKSATLGFLIEQLGVANAERFTWVNTSPSATIDANEEDGRHDYVLRRNFDPFKLVPDPYVNGFRYSYRIMNYSQSSFPFLPGWNRIANVIPLDQTLISSGSASAIPFAMNVSPSLTLHEGEYFVTLTRDDYGALRYLYDGTNINVEPVATGVQPVPGNPQIVQIAPRPGVEKITFQRFDPGQLPLIQTFPDRYFSNGIMQTQIVRRVVSTPDVLFTASRHGLVGGILAPSLVLRNGPNFSHLNAGGAGIFQPGVVISFHKLGDIYSDPPAEGTPEPRWGAFNGVTISPSIYPKGPAYQSGRTISLEIQGIAQRRLIWKLRLIGGIQYALENSTDLIRWYSVSNFVAQPSHAFTNSVGLSASFLRVRRLSP